MFDYQRLIPLKHPSRNHGLVLINSGFTLIWDHKYRLLNIFGWHSPWITELTPPKRPWNVVRATHIFQHLLGLSHFRSQSSTRRAECRMGPFAWQGHGNRSYSIGPPFVVAFSCRTEKWLNLIGFLVQGGAPVR